MPTIVSFYQRFPNEAPPLNLSAFDRTGYTYAENFRRNERCYEAEQCEVTSDDGSVVLSLDVRIRPRGGDIEALPRVKVGMKILLEASDAAEARWVIQGARTAQTLPLTAAQKKAIHRFCMDCEESAITYQPAFLWYKDYCTKA